LPSVYGFNLKISLYVRNDKWRFFPQLKPPCDFKALPFLLLRLGAFARDFIFLCASVPCWDSPLFLTLLLCDSSRDIFIFLCASVPPMFEMIS
jgi:hypothetical protein